MTIAFLLSSEAAKQRKSRVQGGGFVVHMETRRGFEELDADSMDHAFTLGEHWVEHGLALSACVRRTFPDGTLSKRVGDFIA